MAVNNLEKVLLAELDGLKSKGTLKGHEAVITGIKPAHGDCGPRYCLAGQGDKEFLLMNANSYLGLSLNQEVIKAEEDAARMFGSGPGAVRFISGTYEPHVELEKNLAKFHDREAAMIFSAAYATVMGVLPQFISKETIVVSDELNHNSIINAIRLSKPASKAIYKHLDMADLEIQLKENIGKGKRVIVVTDGVFSMRGDHAPLDVLVEICDKFQQKYEEGIISVVDDSHGVGVFGKTGRGTEEYTNAKVDVLIATLGKAFGVNGGYVAASSVIINYLREAAPFYIYSNPITPAEAAASIKALEIVNSPNGLILLEKVRQLTKNFEDGLQQLGYEIIPNEHPIVPLMIRDTHKTSELVRYLFEKGILATGLKFPVVPKGDEEIRFQVSAIHSENDINYVLGVLKHYQENS